MGQVAESASPASRLPQVSGAAQARDGAGCRVRIAGKPAPTDIGCSAVQARDGAGCRVSIAGKPAPTDSRCSAGQGWGRLQDHHRRQVGSHRYWVQCRPCGSWLASDGAGCRVSIAGSRLPQVMGAVQALWELACQGWGGLQGQHRRQAGSHRYWVQCRPDGRLLARDGAGAESASPVSRLPQVLGAVHALWELACQRWGRCRVSIAGKPAPTGIGCSAGLVGAGLPAMGQVAGLSSPQAAPSGQNTISFSLLFLRSTALGT